MKFASHPCHCLMWCLILRRDLKTGLRARCSGIEQQVRNEWCLQQFTVPDGCLHMSACAVLLSYGLLLSQMRVAHPHVRADHQHTSSGDAYTVHGSWRMFSLCWYSLQHCCLLMSFLPCCFTGTGVAAAELMLKLGAETRATGVSVTGCREWCGSLLLHRQVASSLPDCVTVWAMHEAAVSV